MVLHPLFTLGSAFCQGLNTCLVCEGSSSLKAIADTIDVITAAMVMVAVLTKLYMKTPVRVPNMKMLDLHGPQPLKK